MNDQIIRAAFHHKILKNAHNHDDTFVIDELGLKNGEIRADIAVLNGKLVGYEIKTEKDTLDRLASQILAYNEVFDKAFIITGEKHLSKVLLMVPEWWGIYLIKKSKYDKIYFSCLRKAKSNTNKTSYGIAQLLWKPEVLEIACSEMITTLKSNITKHELYTIISANYDPNKLGKIALSYLKNRKNWRINH